MIIIINISNINIKIFRKSGFVRRNTIAQNEFWTNVYRLPHSWRKGHCAYAKRCFYGFSDDFSFFAVPFAGSGKWMQSVSACLMNETGGHTQRAIREEWLLSPGWTSPVGSENNHTSFVVVCPFHVPVMSFSFWWFLFYGFSPEVFSTQSASGFVYLHFAPFSEPHQSVIFVLGAKVIPGLDGKARSSLLFSVKISSPAGSILTEKPCIP